MDDRGALAARFLADAGWRDARRVDLAGDASARRYQRLVGPGGSSAILMDAPPGLGLKTDAFLRIAGHLTEGGLSAPRVLASDLDAGLVLLEDLGDAVFDRVILGDPATEETLYLAAVDVLVAVQGLPALPGLDRFTPALLAEQVAPVFDWYGFGLTGQLDETAKAAFQAELETVLKDLPLGRQGLLLRDFHAQNLIWLPDRAGAARVGLLDFQDAMHGPAAYDLVSLLQDARRDVNPALADRMIERFVLATGAPGDAVRREYFALGAQRNLRILGVFARLSLRFGKPQYVDLIPRVWHHAITCLAAPGMERLAAIVHRHVPAPTDSDLQFLRGRCGSNPTL